MALGTTENTVAKITGYVVKNALMAFKNTRLFSGLVTKAYDDEFAERGAKKGDTIYVRKPAQFRVRTGSKMKTQNIKETKIPVVIGEQKGVDFEFSIREATLDIDHNKSDYAERFIRPAGSTLASTKDAEGMAKASKGAGYTVISPIADTNEQLYSRFTTAKAMLNKFLAPKGVSERYAVVGSDIENRLAQSVSTLFNASSDITRAIKTAGMEHVGTGGLTWGTSDLAYVHTNGAGGATAVSASSVVPNYDSETQEITLSAIPTGLVVGDTLVFTDSKFVNAETKALYAQDLQRKVLAIDAGNSKVIVYSIRPAVITLGGVDITTDNVDDTAVVTDAILNTAGVTRDEVRGRLAMANCSTLPKTASSVEVLGISGKHYLCCPVFQKKAVVLTSVDLVRPTKVEMSDIIRDDGMSIRFLEDYTIENDSLPDRLDMMAEFTNLYPEWIVDVEVQLD